jgi:outer membrane protein OmpA-like peptidoglycan-associated protein
MPHAQVSRRRSSLGRALTQALVLSLLPLGTAFAQSFPAVRVTRDGTEIKAFRTRGDVYMTAPKGALLEVIYIEGDRYKHLDSNWYWVILPRAQWGAGRAGWIRGDAVEYVPPQEPAPAPRVSLAEAPQARQARNEPRDAARPARVPVEEVPAARPVIPDVVLNFEFDKSELTDEARRRLATAFPAPTASARGISVALEGHADWTGSDPYNQKLGQARADTVRRYLTEQLRIPAERISVVSYGEASPVAPNTTREGRARNRRVVIKGGA